LLLLSVVGGVRVSMGTGGMVNLGKSLLCTIDGGIVGYFSGNENLLWG